MKKLYLHAHIIPDSDREYLDGALLIEDGKILDVFAQSRKVNLEEEREVIDASGKIIIPAFFDPYTEEESGQGCVRSIRVLHSSEDVSLKEGELGFHNEKGVPLHEKTLSVSSDHEEAEEAKRRGAKILLKAGYPLDVYDGFLPVLREDFLDEKGESLSALALEGQDYTEVHGSISKRTLSILLRLIDRKKLILCGGKVMDEAYRKALELGARWCDIVACTSMNAYALYGLEKLYGGLKRGKKADYLLLDKEGNILERYREGRRL